MLAKLRSEVHSRLGRRNPRLSAAPRARLIVEELAIEGTITDLGAGGIFLRADVLVETGERGVLTVGNEEELGVPVKASFTRTATDDEYGGLGLAFEMPDATTEFRVLELILNLLDAHCVGQRS